jgi:uncharacterized protein YegL
MPVEFTKKPKVPKAPKPTEPPLLGSFLSPRDETRNESGLVLSNRAARTPIAWMTDASPSLAAFAEAQLACAASMVEELKKLPTTSRTVVMNIVQVGTPPVATGFSEIAQFRVPELHAPKSTPLHTALDRMTSDLGMLFSDFRSNGIERTDSVVIITTDGYANDTTQEELDTCIRKFLELGKKWSVTNLVVGVGAKLNEDLLKSLANTVPPLRLEELNAACLMPFIQKVAERVSESRRGQKLVLELPEGIEPIE